MRICVIGPVPPLPGGVSQHNHRLIEALRSAGHDVDVVTWRSQYPPLLYRGPRTDATDAEAGAERLLVWWNPLTWWAARRRAAPCDVIVLHWITPFHVLAYRAIVARRRARAVVVVHNAFPHEPFPFTKLLTRWFLGTVDGAVAHSRAVADDLARMVPGLTVAVSPLPPNLPLTPRPLPPHPPLRLLFFGLIRPYKGLDVALGAVRRLRDEGIDVTLTVAGVSWEPIERWTKAAADLGISDGVVLRGGYVPDAEVQELFASHHIVVAPYKTASQSAIVPLAQAAGRPVVATDVGGLAETVGDGVDGILVPPDDAAALADGIRRAADALDELGRNAPAKVSSWAAIASLVTGFASTAGSSDGSLT